MATVTEITPEHELQRSLKKRQILAIGLVWGALVVFIFHLWFNAKDRASFGEGLFILLQVLGYPVLVVSLAIAVLLFFGKGGAGEPQERLARTHSQQHFFGLLILVAGALYFLAGAWLFFSQPSEGMAVGVGLALFGLIAQGAGYKMVAKPKAPLQDRIMKVLGNNQKPIGLVLFIVGALCVLVGLYLRFKTKANPLAGQPMIQLKDGQLDKDAPEKTHPARISDAAPFPQ